VMFYDAVSCGVVLVSKVCY